MFRCKGCDAESRDGVQCTSCSGSFDYTCAGITETGYRRLGDNRKATWKCPACKKSSASLSQLPATLGAKSPSATDMDAVLGELKQLSLQVSILPTLDESVKSIKAQLAELKTMKPELAEIKSSIDFVDHRMASLSDKLIEMEKDIQALQKTKMDVENLHCRVLCLETQLRENEQRSRLNNIEIKGVPVLSSENLFDVVAKIGSHINYIIPKEQINYIARVPMRNDKKNKTIIVAIHSRYIKEEFVATAKKCNTSAGDLGLSGDAKIFVNDHLTVENKILLNKAKARAKEQGFMFTWVTGCKIRVRKNATSPVIIIRSESDLKKI